VFHGGAGQTSEVLTLSDDDRLQLVDGLSQLRDLGRVTVRKLANTGRDGRGVGSLEVRLCSDDVGG
jgi:hypothetical protein